MRRERAREGRDAIVALQLWWLNRMLTTPAPLQEKMTLYFHGHFTSRAKPMYPWITYDQNALFRRYALGNLRELALEVSKDAAMLLYLNGAQNVAAHPNENYARELMELFTLGVDNYSEQDVRESARAWTGWSVNRRNDTVTFDAALHDSGSKLFSAIPATLPATTSSASSSPSRSARDSLRPACSTGSCTTIPNRSSSTTSPRSCGVTISS